MKAITYKDSGVDIDAGDALVDRIKPFAAKTRIPEVLADVGWVREDLVSRSGPDRRSAEEPKGERDQLRRSSAT